MSHDSSKNGSSVASKSASNSGHTLDTLRDATFAELNALVVAGEIGTELAGQVMQAQNQAARALGEAKAREEGGVKKGPGKKTECPLDSREQFVSNAEALEVTIGGVKYSAEVKEFSTGSLGWYLTGKATVVVDGVRCPVQVGLNLTLIGSKELV